MPQSVWLLWTRDRPDAETSTWQHTTLKTQKRDIHAPEEIRTRNSSKRTASFIGALAKLRKVTISFAVSVCPSVHTGKFGSHWTDLHEIWFLSFLSKNLSKKFKFYFPTILTEKLRTGHGRFDSHLFQDIIRILFCSFRHSASLNRQYSYTNKGGYIRNWCYNRWLISETFKTSLSSRSSTASCSHKHYYTRFVSISELIQ
jgi:hypothetical protein